MEKLRTIQKRNNLNEVFRSDDAGAGGASHCYLIVRAGTLSVNDDTIDITCPDDVIDEIRFQHGPRNESGSTPGVLDCDLLEIVRDRLAAFQDGEFATRENENALRCVEEALLWMNKRIEDRAERQVLGTYQV